MNQSQFGAARSNHLGLLFVAAIVVTGLLLLIFQFASGAKIVTGAPLADCTSPNVPSFIDSDTELSGSLFADSTVTVHNGASLFTLTAGTEFTFCDEYDLIANGGKLHLVGTKADPIVFDSADSNQKWGRIYFTGAAKIILTSTLQYVELNNGGGSDTDADRGAIHIMASAKETVGITPVIDRVTINNSGSYGIFVLVREDDPTPPSITNLTVNGSANAPVLMYASSVGGLGGGNSFSNNGKQIIEVRVGGSNGASIDHSQTWRDQPLPYELVGTGVVNGLDIGDATNLPVLTLQPGVTLLIGEDIFIRVNNGGLIAEGTAIEPITFTRVGANSPLWRQILFGQNIASVSRLAYVNISYANSATGSVDIRDGSLSLDHVSIKNNSAGAGVYSRAPLIEIKNSTIEFNRVGVEFVGGGNGLLRNNLIRGNIDAGVLVTNNINNSCIDAIGNDWGSAGGPMDSSPALDACNQAKSNNGGGSSVSDDVLYEPWLRKTGLTDHTSISPEPYWVVSNGIDQALLTITLRDSNGQPVPGKQIELATTRGVIQQPGELTDSDGVTTTVIKSTVVGDAVITARNVSENQPLSGIASVNFWQGQGDAGSLISPSGVPYDSPHILVDGKPFQEGFPMTFRVPMQNSSQEPVQVTVKYGVSGLGLGMKFAPVDAVQATLQPGESWDALGGWLPTVTGHKCVQATITSDVSLSLLGINLTGQQNEFTTQKNTDISSTTNSEEPKQDPDSEPPPAKPRCASPPEDEDLAPTSMGENEQENLEKVVEHQGNQIGSWAWAWCKIRTLGDPSIHGYEEIVQIPVFTPPLINAGPGVTAEQAIALNHLSETSTQLVALTQAAIITQDRMAGASAAGEWHYAALQLQAFRDYLREIVIILNEYADGLDILLAATDGAGIDDFYIEPQEFTNSLEQLRSQGYDVDTLAFLQASGYSSEFIDDILAKHIIRLEQSSFGMTTYYTILRNQRDNASALADHLAESFDLDSSQGATLDRSSSVGLDTSMFIGTPPMYASFRVGNPTGAQATVELRIRPVDVPVDWSYRLSDPAPVLDPGETNEVLLLMDPNGFMLRGRVVRFGVEGYIDGEYIGGVYVERRVPEFDFRVRLPMMSSQ